MVGYTRAVVRSLARPIFVWLLFATATFTLLDAALFAWLERPANPAIGGYFDALYLTVTTITGVGYGDVVPVTRAGKVLAMLSMLGGTGIFVAYTAVLASSIIDADLDQRRARKHERGHSDH